MKVSSLISILPSCVVTLATVFLLSSCGAEKTPAPESPGETPERVEESAPAEAPSVKLETPAEEVLIGTEKESASEVALAGVSSPEVKPMKEGKPTEAGREVATLGGGCFWCTEAVMERLEGVIDVVSGYMGGHVENPTYEQIGTKTTGHAEVIEVTFDPSVITFEEILDVFWQAHDPTTLDQQGADIGPQYRSVIYYHSPEQRNIAMQSMKKMNESGMYADPAVTEISEASKFWVAEDYHQNYYELNKDSNPYCRIVISPKLKKLGME